MARRTNPLRIAHAQHEGATQRLRDLQQRTDLDKGDIEALRTEVQTVIARHATRIAELTNQHHNQC